MKTMMKWCWCLLLCLCACGGATEPEPDGRVSSTLDTDIDTRRADAPLAWHVKTDGMTMWVDTVMEPTSTDDGTLWTLRGRVSKTMNSFRAYDAEGVAFEGKMVSARKFEVVLSAQQLLDVVAGARIYLDFFARGGITPMYHGMVQFAARFADWAGTSGIYVFRAVNPVIIADELKFRGRANTKSGFELGVVYTDDDAGPVLFDDGPNEYHFDWTPAALHLAADPPEDPVWFRGSDTASTPVEKTASLQMRLVQMGIGTKAPMTAWPPLQCQRDVKVCLEDLETADTSTCGWAYEVRPCLDAVQLPLGADPARFAADLKDAILAWYTDHEADVRALGGRSLDASLRAIREDRVGELDPEEIDLFGYDPAHFDVFFHVDPVFPGSDRVWYGVYDHAGALISTEAVN